MTLESSASIGPIAGILATGAFPHVKPDVAPLPALTPGGGVPVGDGALWMPKASDPAHRAAAWQFMTWLNSPERQAEMAAAGGYVPTRLSAVDQPVLQAKWKEFPMFRVAHDQLLGGEMSDANVGTLLGEYQGLRNAVRDGLIRTLRQNVDPEKAARDAKAEADIVIQEYNDRVGA